MNGNIFPATQNWHLLVLGISHIFVASTGQVKVLVGLLVVCEASGTIINYHQINPPRLISPESSVEEIFSRAGVPHVIAQSVGQFQILVIRYSALYSSHLLESVAELVEEILQPGVLQTGDVHQTGGQFDVVVSKLLVDGRHLV